MAEQSVIREFLVALGFKTDEGALRKFQSGIDQATKSAVKLATAVEATAVIVAAGVARFTSNLEALYFASIKAGASATNLKAYDRAAQNLGASAGEAIQSVQGLARFLRNNPGGQGLLESLGVQTREVNGELRDTTDIMLGLAAKFAKMPYYLANQYADLFGISEDTLRAMRSGGFEQEVRRMREEMRKTGFDRASQDAHRFMLEMRDLQTQLEAFGIQVYDALVKKLGGGLGSLTSWLRENGPMVAERVAEVLITILELAEKIIPAITWLVNKFIEWDKATDGWSTRLLAFLAVLKLFGGASIIGGVLSLAGAFVNLGAGIAGAGASTVTLLGLLTRLGLIGGAAAAGWWLGNKVNEHLSDESKNKIGKAVAFTMAALGNNEAKESLAISDPKLAKNVDSFHEGIGKFVAATMGVFGDREAREATEINDPTLARKIDSFHEGVGKFIAATMGAFGNKEARESIAVNDPMLYFRMKGWSKEQAAGLVANFQAESGMNPRAVGDGGQAYGIAQWHPDRQYEFAKFAGKDIEGSTVAEQLDFVDWELKRGAEQKAGKLLQAATNSRQAAEIVSRHYERPLNVEVEAAKRGEMAVQLSQKTDVHVYGTTDPNATGRAVAEQQKRVNSEMTRNLRVAVQ